MFLKLMLDKDVYLYNKMEIYLLNDFKLMCNLYSYECYWKYFVYACVW